MPQQLAELADFVREMADADGAMVGGAVAFQSLTNCRAPMGNR